MTQVASLCCAIDPLDPSSRVAVRQASALARRLDAELLLLHVTPEGPDKPTELTLRPGREDSVVSSAVQRFGLGQLVDEAIEGAGQAVRLFVANGAPAARIIDFAHERGCTLIAVGTHARRPLERLILGSVADQVVRASECPVIVARSSLHTEEVAEDSEEAAQYR